MTSPCLDAVGGSGRRRRLLLLGAFLLVVLSSTAAPATVEEQRSRLPPPAECTDPVAGIWQAHAFYAHVQQWYVFTLRIERRDGPESPRLAGDIRARWWHGGAAQQQPPPCGPGVRRGLVYEPAEGSIDQRRLVFNATSLKAERDECGLIEGGYLLDRFSGEIDPERQEFQSVLNADAPEWKDVPTVFRRIKCLDEADDAPSARPGVKVTPPPLGPAGKTRSSCDCTRPGG